MDALRLFETSTAFDHTTGRHTPQDIILMMPLDKLDACSFASSQRHG